MTYFSKGKKMWHYPANSTIERLRANGYREIVLGNGDFLCI